MARRGRRKRGGRKSKTIPVLPTLAAVYPAIAVFKTFGVSAEGGKQLIYNYTGFHPDGGGFQWPILARTAGPIIVGVIAHKVLNKTGVNKYVRKATMGWLSL